MKKILIVLFIMVGIIWLNKDVDQVIIPHEAIRFRVIANSDTKEDQLIKALVQEDLQKQIPLIFRNINNIRDGRKKIKNSLEQFKTTIETTLNQYKMSMEYQVSFGYHYFPEKIHRGVALPEGKYESLVVILGDGLGSNFWCILFPPLCLLEADLENMDEVEYRSFVKDRIKHYF